MSEGETQVRLREARDGASEQPRMSAISAVIVWGRFMRRKVLLSKLMWRPEKEENSERIDFRHESCWGIPE